MLMVSSYINSLFLLLSVFVARDGKACAYARFRGDSSFEALLLLQQNFSRLEGSARNQQAVDSARKSELSKALAALSNQWLLLHRRYFSEGVEDPRWRVLFALASFVAATLAYQTWSTRALRIVKANSKSAAGKAAFKPETRAARGEHSLMAKSTKGQAMHGFSRVLSQVKLNSTNLAIDADAEANKQFCDKLLLQAQKRLNSKPRDVDTSCEERQEDVEATQPPLNVVAGGVGGIEELRNFLDDSAVTWSLLRFQVEGDSSSSTKFVLLHFNGEDVLPVTQGRLNARTTEAIELFGETQTKIEVKRKEEVTVDLICERVLPVIVSDSSEKTNAASIMKQEYESMIAEAQQTPPRVSRTAKGLSKGAAQTQDVLNAVAVTKGCYNWVLIEPDGLELHNGGSGGLDEMKEWLDDTKVLFGVIRFTFGVAIVRYVFVHWVGSAVGAVKRARWNAKIGDAESYCRKLCIPKVKQEVHALDDLKLEQIVREIRRLEQLDTEDAAITAEEYMANLEQERLEQPVPEETGELMGLKRAVEAVRGGDGDGNCNWNWVMVGVGTPMVSAGA